MGTFSVNYYKTNLRRLNAKIEALSQFEVQSFELSRLEMIKEGAITRGRWIDQMFYWTSFI